MLPRPGDTIEKGARPPRVSITREGASDADQVATKSILEAYSDIDGFHCPRCSATITNVEEAISHIADEINSALSELEQFRRTEGKGD